MLSKVTTMRLALIALTAAIALAQPAARPTPGFDLSGYWTTALHEDGLERGAGPEIADYAGFPVNEAARLFGLSYNASRVTLRNHQCDGYVVPYQVRAIGNARAWEERDSRTQRLIAIHWYNQTFEGHRTIWMDGRPHPPVWAPHSWMGFSTGRFAGNALVVETTHLKQGWLRRNGLPQSDQATTVEFFVRHGDHLGYTSIVNDPVYLTEPHVKTTDFARQPVDHGNWLFACDDGEQILDRPADVVPNYLFGQNPFLREINTKYKVPIVAYLGGAETMYPEFAAKLLTATEADALAKTLPVAGQSLTSRAIETEPRDGEIHVLHLRNNVYLLTGDGGNIVVQTGDQGAFVVNTGTGAKSGNVLEAIRKLTTKPIQFIANTGFRRPYTGGNQALRAAGLDPSVQGSFFSLQFADAGRGATILSHQNVQDRMAEMGMPAAGIPSDTFLEARRRKFHNGDAIEMFYQPNATSDADSIVHFRAADVIVTGDLFTTTRYPLIEVAKGGSVAGLIQALNDILNRVVYEHGGEGGTIIVPGQGYVSDEHEVTEYRDMLVIVRDRVRAMMRAGSTRAQIQAARVTADYDTRYGANTGPWTTQVFVDAVYDSLSQSR